MEMIKDKLLNFRAQALCIKTNVQILKDLWVLQNEFKEKNVGAFYKTVQENCIFRIVLETYKMLYDKTAANMISNMANSVYQKMLEIWAVELSQVDGGQKRRSSGGQESRMIGNK